MYWKIAKIGNCEVVDFAASELKKYMSLMDSTKEYVIMSFDKYDSSSENIIWLGESDSFLSPEVENPELDDAIAIDIHNCSGYITGSNSRSILIGVYRFLSELGCAFVRPGSDGEIIPKKSLENAEVSVFEAASYRHRGVCIEGAVSAEHVLRNIDWLPKVGMNAFFNQFQIPFTFYDRWYSHKNNPYLKEENFTLKDAEGIMNTSIEEIKKRGLIYHATGHGWTCEPFGIEGSGWDEKDYDVPEETKPYLALVDGKRELWGNVPLNTNLCYSSEYVKETIANAVKDYCIKFPQVDALHVWLADGMNNHCECENCINIRPADLYVQLLNRIDEVLCENNIKTKVVFLIYVDLLWEPQQFKLNNPDRFILMFAPITRTYTESMADAKTFDTDELSPYVRNKVTFPNDVSENLARLFKWQENFNGDSFIYDYHYMWDHFLDPGYYKMAKTLFRDMKHLDKYHINGMISCQNQRVFFPSALGMVAMARVLWDKTITFEDVAESYFKEAFGENGKKVMNYLSDLSVLFNPPYLRGELPVINPESEQAYAQIPRIVDGFKEDIISYIANGDDKLHTVQKSNWKNLLPHGDLCKLLAKAFEYMSRGDVRNAEEALNDALDFACRCEAELHNVFDVCLFYNTYKKAMRTLKKKL